MIKKTLRSPKWNVKAAMKLCIIGFLTLGFAYGCHKNGNKSANGNSNNNAAITQNKQAGNQMNNNQMGQPRNNQASQDAHNQKKKIKKNWTKFFSSKTGNKKRIHLLQNGKKFKKTIKHFSSSKMGKDASVTVNSVQVNGKKNATVNYTINLSNKPVLKNQKGKAVYVNHTWKVSDEAFCGLLALGGNVPSACPQQSKSSS
jgi:hypothetical protein